MLVRDFMSTDVTTLQETNSLLDATLIFMQTHFRHLPVLSGQKLVGIVTERDVRERVPSLMTRGGAEEYNSVLESTSVSQVMTRNPVTVRPDQAVSEAARTLYSMSIGCLPVIEDDELKGVITTTDMLRLLVQLTSEKEVQD